MTIKARTGLVPEWYTPISENQETPQARFKLKPPTGAELMDLRAAYVSDTKRFTGHGAIQALASCLLDCENVTDAEGKKLSLTLENIAALPMTVLTELTHKLVAMAVLTEPERKN